MKTYSPKPLAVNSASFIKDLMDLRAPYELVLKFVDELVGAW